MPIPWSKDRGIGYFHFLLLKLGYSNKTNNPNDSPNKRMFGLFSCGRSGEAQTRGLRIPNAARYQLRYTPIVIKLWSCKWSNLWSKVFCRNTRRRKSEETREKRRFCELSAFGSRGGHTLPKQAGNRYPTSRYSVFGVKSVGVQIKGARDPALRIRSARRLSPPRLSCSGSEPPGTPHTHFCPRRQSDLPYCRRKCRRTDASAG